jgi:adenine specific DNA methylase Mod
MPTLNWIGKEAVVKHHKDVPYRLLERVPELDCGECDSGNLIVQGDNLHALKALLPRYAGQVKCIYIDPPYNTGNEGWVYCDNVNSPEIRQWLNSVVGKEGETLDRHDRWLCMMYPRLLLLREFLRDDGVIFVSIDDNEVAHLRLLMDEIFGGANFVTDIIWRSSDASNNDAKQFSVDYNHTLTYSKLSGWQSNRLDRSEENNAHYKNPDNDPNGVWFSGNVSSPNPRINLTFDVIAPNGNIIKPPKNGWRWKKETMDEMIERKEIIFSEDQKRIIKKTYLKDQVGIIPSNIWWDIEDTGHNRNAKYELIKIFSELKTSDIFKTPKPTKFIEKIIKISCDKNSIILDSFAGSGTTAHAVLNLNKQDGGNRSVILVEMDETIAETITAERNRRIIEGYDNAKGEPVEGLGGGFQFYRLSKEPLFTADGQVRRDVTFAQLAEFVWFKETGTGFTGCADSPLLGVFHNSAVYLLYNGILGDNDPEKGNVLTPSIYKTLPPFQGRKIIYATACRGGDSWLNREQIVLKQTPYELNV